METQAKDLGENPGLYKIRHSLAHVLAQAVLELRPGSTLGFGPPIEDGFYYDFVLSEPLSEADFPAIEKKMKHIIKQGQRFEREETRCTAPRPGSPGAARRGRQFDREWQLNADRPRGDGAARHLE